MNACVMISHVLRILESHSRFQSLYDEIFNFDRLSLNLIMKKYFGNFRLVSEALIQLQFMALRLD